MEGSYLPVQWVHREVIEEAILKEASGRVFYFCEEEEICSADGTIMEMKDLAGQGVFITLDSGKKIRIDKIITLFGKPGAAYEEYEAYANACLSCNLGYE
jgi:hypothetical protein